MRLFPPGDGVMHRQAARGRRFDSASAGNNVDVHEPRGVSLIVLGVILLILGFLFGVGILWTLGIILIVIGVILWILGSMDRAVFGRRYWY